MTQRRTSVLAFTRRVLLHGAARAAALWSLLPLIPSSAACEDPPSGDDGGLAVLLRDLFPHQGLDDAFYRDIASAVRGQLDAAAIGRVDAGLRRLDELAGGPWGAAAPDVRQSRLQSVAQEPFFKQVYGSAIELVYRDPRTWKVIGYGGNALAQGGYLARGFNEIDWLPADPP